MWGILDSEREVGGIEKGHHPLSHSDHTAGRRSRERERERDARGENSLGQGREVLTFVNGRGAKFVCLIEAWVNCSLFNTANGQRVESCN